MSEFYEKYPEHEKLKNVEEESQRIGEFLDWLTHERGFVLAAWGKFESLYPQNYTVEGLLADYYKIDLIKIEKEKRQMLEGMRSANKK